MIAVYTKETVAALEQEAFQTGLTERSALMERAGRSVFCAIETHVAVKNQRAVVLCGGGNNGGDGYVCARLLKEAGCRVTTVTVGDPATEGCREMAGRYTGERVPLHQAQAVLQTADIVVEAVWGTGFHGALPEAVQALFAAVPTTAFRVACDLPAGLTANENSVAPGAFSACLTVTFFGMKPCLTEYPAAAYAGQVLVEPLGLPREFLDRFPRVGVLGQAPVFQPRHPAAHKGTYGTVGILAGHYGMAGAALLCGTAALRSGCGIVKLATEEAIYPTVTVGLPEAVCLPYAPGERPEGLLSAGALAVGCGLSVSDEKAALVEWLLNDYEGPLVLDADGLNNCVSRIEWLQRSKAQLILTPHMGEMARLCGVGVTQIQNDRSGYAEKLAKTISGVVVLKGPYTLITDGVRTVYNPTGNPGLATGGSGDVLAGVIAGLCAGGLSPFDAARYGAWLHGRAADRAAQTVGQISLMPRDVLDALPACIKECEATSCGGLPLFV